MVRKLLQAVVLVFSLPLVSEIVFEEDANHTVEVEYVLVNRPKCRGAGR